MSSSNSQQRACGACAKRIERCRPRHARYCLQCAEQRNNNWNEYVANWRKKHPQQYRHQNNIHARNYRSRKLKAQQQRNQAEADTSASAYPINDSAEDSGINSFCKAIYQRTRPFNYVFRLAGRLMVAINLLMALIRLLR